MPELRESARSDAAAAELAEPVTVLPEEEGEASGSASGSLLGQTLGGRYRVSSLIGSGGMGAVYRAEHVQLQKTVALKVLNAQMAAHREAALRFEREAMVSARIQHPHVVSATDSGRLSDGSLYLVLEFVSGRSLREVIDEEGRLTPARAFAIGAQIADALAAAHRAEIVHRDLKPGNVMLLLQEGNPEFVKVLDFGLARVVGESGGAPAEPLTRSGSVFGTPEYMSPEQARGEAVDHRADLYALGVILYELLSGRPPFQAPELVAVLIKHIQEPPPPLPPDIPAAMAEVVLSLLDKSPERRPEDARQVAKTLRRLAPPVATFSTAPPRSDATSLDRGGVRPRAPGTLRQIEAALGKIPWGELARRPGPWLSRAMQRLASHTPAWLRPRALLERSRASLRRVPEAFPPGSWVFWRNAGLGMALALLAIVLVMALWPDSVSEELRDRARQGEPEAIVEIARVPERKRTAQTQLALGLGYMSSGQIEPGLDALALALEAEPELAGDVELQRAVRRAAEDAGSRDRALELAATRLAAGGVDLLFDVWVSTPGKTPATRAARKWLDTDSVRAAASPAARLALEIRDVKGCAAARELVARAADVGDARSLRSLQRFQAKTGCGFLSLEDCYPCLREDGDELEQAIAKVSQRPAPKF